MDSNESCNKLFYTKTYVKNLLLGKSCYKGSVPSLKRYGPLQSRDRLVRVSPASKPLFTLHCQPTMKQQRLYCGGDSDILC